MHESLLYARQHQTDSCKFVNSSNYSCTSVFHLYFKNILCPKFICINSIHAGCVCIKFQDPVSLCSLTGRVGGLFYVFIVFKKNVWGWCRCEFPLLMQFGPINEMCVWGGGKGAPSRAYGGVRSLGTGHSVIQTFCTPTPPLQHG